jgi:hypothetical protein
MRNRQPREVPLRKTVINVALAYIAWLAKRARRKATLWQTLWSMAWDLAGILALTWAGFQLSSALGGAIAGLGCFFMAQRFRPSNRNGASL